MFEYSVKAGLSCEEQGPGVKPGSLKCGTVPSGWVPLKTLLPCKSMSRFKSPHIPAGDMLGVVGQEMDHTLKELHELAVTFQ